jgi:hypothetical protein
VNFVPTSNQKSERKTGSLNPKREDQMKRKRKVSDSIFQSPIAPEQVQIPIQDPFERQGYITDPELRKYVQQVLSKNFDVADLPKILQLLNTQDIY